MSIKASRAGKDHVRITATRGVTSTDATLTTAEAVSLMLQLTKILPSVSNCPATDERGGDCLLPPGHDTMHASVDCIWQEA